jgi:hypothetical protein
MFTSTSSERHTKQATVLTTDEPTTEACTTGLRSAYMNEAKC